DKIDLLIQNFITNPNVNPAPGNVWINMGSGLDLGSSLDVRTLTNVSSLKIDTSQNILSSVQSQIQALTSNPSLAGFAKFSLDFTKSYMQTQPGSAGVPTLPPVFSFPLLDKPSSAMGLMLGKDVPLFFFNPPPLD